MARYQGAQVTDPVRPADFVAKAEPQRQTLRKHLREHGRATPAHVWNSQCRWCHLGDRWYDLRHKDGAI